MNRIRWKPTNQKQNKNPSVAPGQEWLVRKGHSVRDDGLWKEAGTSQYKCAKGCVVRWEMGNVKSHCLSHFKVLQDLLWLGLASHNLNHVSISHSLSPCVLQTGSSSRFYDLLWADNTCFYINWKGLVGKQSTRGVWDNEGASLTMLMCCLQLAPHTQSSVNILHLRPEPKQESEGDGMCLCVMLSVDVRDRHVCLCLPSKRTNSVM